MTFTVQQEATQAGLIFNDDCLFDIQPLRDHAIEAMTAYGLRPVSNPTTTFDSVRIDAGALAVKIDILDGLTDEETSRIQVSVEQARTSEALHPETRVALLAEILSLLIEQTGGQTVDWQPSNVCIAAAKFQSAFTPIRYRKPEDVTQPERIMPRRVRPGHKTTGPMTQKTLIASMPKDVPLGIRPQPEALTEIFRDDCPANKTTETVDLPARLATWTVTASVGVMNPAIGIPLAAYNALKGEDVRVSAHALTLTAAFFGSSTLGFLPFL